jgi:hypothetical protein
MYKFFCDKHPDREAVATFKIREMPVGARPPMLFIGPGIELDVRMIDLCEECAELVRPLTPSQEKHPV